MPRKKKSKIQLCLACYWRRFRESPLGKLKPVKTAEGGKHLDCPECLTKFGVWQLFEVEV